MSETKPLNGGYGIPYDAEPALEKLATAREEAIHELWENLYHQGDVGLASYNAVPKLVKAGELSLVSAIEMARNSGSNPDIPEYMVNDYEQALNEALNSIPSEEEQYKGYCIIHASINGQNRLAAAFHYMDVEEVLSEYGENT